MSIPARKYDDEQRAAVASAVRTPGITGKRVVELAAAGELTTPEGVPLEPFGIPENTVRSIGRKSRIRDARITPAVEPSGELPRGDEMLERLKKLTLAQLETLEAKAKTRSAPVTGEEIRQLARALAEIKKAEVMPVKAASSAFDGPTPLAAAILRDAEEGPVWPPPRPVMAEEPAQPPPEEQSLAEVAERIAEELRVKLTPKTAEQPKPEPYVQRTRMSGPRPGQTEEELAAEVGHLGHKLEPAAPRHARRLKGWEAMLPR